MSTDDASGTRAEVPARVPTGRAEMARGGRGNVHPLAAVKHGAYQESKIAPLAAAYLDELMDELPSASERILRIQARRLARLELLGRFEDERGVLRNRKRGEPFAATLLAEKISSAYVKVHLGLEAQQREAGDSGRQTLADIEAELAGDAEDSEGES